MAKCQTIVKNYLWGDGSCKHVAAALFGILTFSTDLHDSAGPSVTDVPAYWTAPKRICKPVAVEDLDIRADVTTARSDGPTHQDGYFPIPEDQLDKKRIEKDMVKLLKNCKVPGVALYTLSDSDSDLEDIERDNFKNTVDLVRDSGYSSLCEYTHKYKDQIREGTFGQSSNQMWKYQRLGRLTASMFYKAYHYKGGKENNSIVKSCLGKYGDFTTKATQYGIEKEAIARTQYVDKMFNLHTSFLCEETGLHLNPQFPYLGASPDGLVKCKCCQQGVLEIKCPFSMRDLTPEEALTKLPSFRESNGKMELIQNVNSPYYIQMLGQMGICKAPYCDLVLYTTKGIYVERAFFNEALWNNVVLKLKIFYESYILPSILSN
ncbi:uncharacterized protein LOC134244264 [Saccostrea cucullata]|uniref:uncharacterized protein LOC134244264 n=1 Tax=Saccostrea cuccullata TaxID=36930 RepID=UPI002ED16697